MPTSAPDTLIGTSGSDWIQGYLETYQNGYDGDHGPDSDGDVIRGLGGDDWLDGGNGNDRLYGGAGDDTVLLSGGRDTVFGGVGNDRFETPPVLTYHILGPSRYDGGAGSDYLLVHNRSDGNAVLSLTDPSNWQILPDGTRFRDFEQILFINHAGNVHLTGGDLDDILANLGTGDCQFFGGKGDDHLAKENSASTSLLSGGAGNDLVWATHDSLWISADTLDGGTGRDALFLSLDGYGPGITLALNNPVTPDSGLTIRNFEQLFFYGGAYGDHVTGGRLQDQLDGAGGDDILRGGGGGDWINGGASDIQDTPYDGDDTLFGGAGDDHLRGGMGQNRLFGGAGIDQLVLSGQRDTATGGPGADLFDLDFPNFWESKGTVARITDFAPEDSLNLRNFYFSPFPSWTLAPDAFALGTTATDARDRILYDPTTGIVRFDADGSGENHTAIRFLQLTPGTALTPEDFLFL